MGTFDHMAPDPGLYSTDRAAHAAGCTRRMMDHWMACGVLAPTLKPHGSGSKSGWSETDIALARVFAVLAGLGARTPVLAQVAFSLQVDPDLWSGSVIVTADETVGLSREARWRWPDGWVVSLANCRQHVADALRQLVAA